MSLPKQTTSLLLFSLLLSLAALLVRSVDVDVDSSQSQSQSPSPSQYACTLAAPADENACLAIVVGGDGDGDGDSADYKDVVQDDVQDDHQDHCAWCALSSFGFCVSEVQAAQFEQSIPGIECDRWYSGKSEDDDDADADAYNDADANDDVAPLFDDAFAVVDNDVAAPVAAADDDNIEPTEGTMSDDYWTCLQAKDEASCGTDAPGCTWCMTKVGFGLCMAGPSADFAANSDWFICATPTREEQQDQNHQQDPYDPSCISAYLQDPTESGCEAAADQDGNGCQWCNLAGMADVCLTAEQASAGAPLGLTCDGDGDNDNDKTTSTARHEEEEEEEESVQDPLDPACMLAFLQDPTGEGCASAVDRDGGPCRYCSYPGMGFMCLNSDQADAGEAIGITCSDAAEEGFEMFELDKEEEDDYDYDFDKDNEEDETATTDVTASLYDSACLMAYLQDPSADGCAGALDEDGTACAYCAYPGIGSVCLASSQVDLISQLGIECGAASADSADSAEAEADSIKVTDRTVVVQGSPLDPACILAFLQDQSEEACTTAVDTDGVACEWCNYQGTGVANMCLTAEQSQMASRLGVSCVDAVVEADPSDTSCIMAFLQDQSEEGCTTAVDMDGAACEWCSYQGLGNLCLTEVQAGMAEQLGVTCDAVDDAVDEDEDEIVQDDPYGTACALAFFENMSKEACTSTVDEEGQPCEYCVMDGAMTLCFNQQQADIAQGLGFSCSTAETEVVDVEEDLYDTSCITAFMEGQGTQDACTEAVDEDGAACKWCHVAGVADVCLTATQGDMATQLGVSCDGSDEIAFKPIVKEEDKVEIPDDFFECLEHYQEGDCNQSSCTWCNSDVGMGFCMADAAARALKECDFFQCDYKSAAAAAAAAAVEPVKQLADPYDPVCLTAGMQNQDDAEDVCNGTMDSDGSPCVWCDAAGVFGLCVSSEQASTVGQFLECDRAVAFKIA